MGEELNDAKEEEEGGRGGGGTVVDNADGDLPKRKGNKESK